MTNQSGFYKLGIAPNILVILDKLRLTTPTPIQEQSIPQAINGKDIVGIAQTGTGKTLAFGIPMIQAALRGKQGLVILPLHPPSESALGRLAPRPVPKSPRQ